MMNNQMLDQILDTLSDNDVIDKQMPQSITPKSEPQLSTPSLSSRGVCEVYSLLTIRVSLVILCRDLYTYFSIWQQVAVRRLLWLV